MEAHKCKVIGCISATSGRNVDFSACISLTTSPITTPTATASEKREGAWDHVIWDLLVIYGEIWLVIEDGKRTLLVYLASNTDSKKRLHHRITVKNADCTKYGQSVGSKKANASRRQI